MAGKSKTKGLEEWNKELGEAGAKAIATPPLKSNSGLYAYQDFEVKVGEDVIAFAKGAKFEPPYGWKRDTAQEELLHASRKKQGDRTGMVFVYEGKVINPDEKNLSLRERQVHTVVLPLEER